MEISMSEDAEEFPGRLLHQAALWDNAELLEDLLHADQLRHINSLDSWGRTPLHAAATTEGSSCLRILLQSGADPNIPCGPRGEYRTALHVSAEHGHGENIRLLLEYGALLELRDGLGLLPVDLAVKGCHTECVSVLRTALASQEAVRLEAFTALHEALCQPSLLEKLMLEYQDELPHIINMAPNGANTLLFKACEAGQCESVKLLLDHGADCRLHPVTKYSPLYIACYYGRKDVVDLLLKRFPDLVQVSTVEKWLPIHACCINGHLSTLELILRYPYPPRLLHKYTDPTGQWEYELAFDVNSRDMSGQTALYMATCTKHHPMVDAMLKFKVRAKSTTSPSSVSSTLTPNLGTQTPSDSSSPTKRRIASGIQALMARLHGSVNGNAADSSTGPGQTWLSPWDVDVYCGPQTALHVAVLGRQLHTVSLLLANGANPNLPINHEDKPPSTCLVASVKLRDLSMIELLLKYGAKDPNAHALQLAVSARDDIVMAKLLALLAHADPDFKINKRAGSPLSDSRSGSTLMFPSQAVMVNWHGLKHLEYLQPGFLVDAAVAVNTKLKLTPRTQPLALHVITRIDISNNVLTEVPLLLLQLHSLRYLNLAQNKLAKLPTPTNSPVQAPSSSAQYQCPVLEELHLQDNRLDALPEEIFALPSLTMLDVSNNKLQVLPKAMWTAPKLKELNASFNLLKSLPSSQDCAEASKIRFDLSIPLGSGKLGLDLVGDDGDSSEEGDARMLRSLQISASNLNAHVLVHPTIWRRTVEVQAGLPLEASTEGMFPLAHLNLAHNAFTELPPCLPCLGVTLTRLNLSYNQLTELKAPSDYPAGLKHLDLSHNQISQWTWESTHVNLSVCYATNEEGARTPVTPGRKLSTKPRAPLMCAHKQHGRLEALRTLVLADNLLTNLQLFGEDDSSHSTWEDVTSSEEIIAEKTGRSRLLFPNLSMLDLSNNKLKEVPPGLPELSNLSVLNLAGNTDITDLPSYLGLLTRLWNLNTKGCNLQEPLKSMVASPRYKTSDIIGYLRSVLEEAKPYARLKLMLVGLQGIGKTTLLEALRSEGMGRRKPPEHWAKRMGHKSIGKTNRGTILSTVGVDIGDWVYEKKLRGQSLGPVIFRTWDFGGQKEYYATHQYFLSRRSLYLVVWKMTDGERGVNDIHQWLVNIQVRAPNSPVIIVGTHSDLVQDPGYVEELQQLIRDRFMNVVDAEKLGLPRVLDTVPVSAKTRYNIKTLCNVVYDTAHSLKLPGSKERLLEQKIPASYLALEDVVCHLSAERRMAGLDPVLNADDYRTSVTLTMQSRHKRSFRDIAELNQATAFLHDNGVLLHYEDATLKDLYFLDPQWLCDMLAHVVTIREINPFARNGIMKLDDLKLLFRWSSATGGAIDARTYVVSLLNKFEVALTWDNRSLLIPSLLPSEEQLLNNTGSETSIPIPVRSRGRSRLPRYSSTTSDPSALPVRPHRAKSAHPIIQSISRPLLSEPKPAPPPYQIEFRSNAEAGLYRMFLLTYLPSGFWSRFMTRLLAHDVIIDTLRHYFTFPKELSSDPLLSASLEWRAEWKLWQTGLELVYLGAVLLRIKEATMPFSLPCHGKLYARQEGIWMPVDRLQGQVYIEMVLPGGSLVVKKPLDGGYQALAVEPNLESLTRLLAVATDHLDTLLEDWYPTLGTRFVHTSEGKFLVNRLVPCPRCLWAEEESVREDEDIIPPPVSPVSRSPRRSRGSVSGDSGVGQESPASSRMASMEGIREERYEDERSHESPLYTFSIEECILAAHESVPLRCPLHRDIQLAVVAPDVAFLDLGDRSLVKSDNVKKGELLGRGAFGFVFRATCKLRGSDDNRQVALKMLQPVDPGADARSSAIAAYKAAVAKWERDSLQQSCKAYCTARQEVSMLMSLRHAYVVSFLGLLPHPLALVLEVAPLGALDHHLKHYRRSGAKLSHYTIQMIILQLGKALEYLHQNHVIYRDLKSENVLVWQLPSPGVSADGVSDVLVKLGDYGISRVALPSGTKGFGGTEGFMAPEMVRYNGEEEYTSQVDIFSFGMLLYELFTLRQPFQGYDAVKEVVLEGGRPPLTEKDTIYPVSMLDLMALCWSQSPKERPSASHIVSVASAPEFTHLLDGVLLTQCQELVVSVTRALHYPENGGGICWEVWLGGQSPRLDLLLSEPGSILEHHSLAIDNCGPPITAACLVGEEAIWLGDSLGQIHAFCTKSYHCLFRYLLEDTSSPVKSLIALPSLGRVAAALGNGRIFLCRSDVIPSTPTGGEGTFLITELGTPTSGESNDDVRCMAAVARRETLELWCGQSEANICIFVLKNGIVTSQEVVSHFPASLAPLQVLHVTTAPLCGKKEHFEDQDEMADDDDDDDDNAEDEEGVAVWSYVHPGCVVYRWDVAQRKVIHRLDCSKLAPCSESLQSISIEEHLSPGRCQVRSLCVLNHLIYIGTTWGCLVVADAATLRPVTVCRPYEADLRLILPLIDPRDTGKHHVMTVGRGYRSLLTRFVGTSTPDNSNLAPLRKPCHALLWSTNPWD